MIPFRIDGTILKLFNIENQKNNKIPERRVLDEVYNPFSGILFVRKSLAAL
jgi:hypothetical protein